MPLKPFADHFSAIAADYAAARPTYPRELFAYLAELAPSRTRAWDCAAGNGQATLPLADQFEEVIATDASAEQIGQMPPHPRIRRYASPAEVSGLEGGAVDLVTVAQALHWLPLPAFWDETRRVLRAGGVVAVWTYGNQRVDQPDIDQRLESFYRSVVGPYWPPERRLVETGYRTIAFPFAELEPPGFDMALEWSLPALLAYVRTWSATNRFLNERGFDPVIALGRELEPYWGEGVRRVRWPLSLRVGRSGGPG
ncbi:MAG TPA: class I SAM-dependent methyltransferase [Gemmatimonadales bacterium]|nr:class I SAM-dependent methyltransferase [Gemmatimonadales bacterium]